MTELTYTLAEARAEIARRECRNEGHDFDVVTSVTLADLSGEPIGIQCRRCSKSWKVTP